MLNRRAFGRSAFAGASLLATGASLLARGARAQTPPFPTQPVRLIVPFAAGGSADVLGRIIGLRLSAKWPSAVFIDNRPGAGGQVGAEQVARAPGDGYTLLVGTIGIHAASSIYAKLGYDPVTDLAPVTVLAEVPNAIAVRPGLPARDLKELVALARKEPGTLTFGSAGYGSSTHMAGELFMLTAGVKLTHVPYRGSSQALNDLVAGSIDLMFENLPTIPPLAQSGAVRVLAVTSAERAAALPDVPTVEQAGVLGYVATAWFTLAAPASTPEPLVERLNSDVRAVLTEPDVRARLQDLGATTIAGSVAESRRFLAAETEKWTHVVKTAGLRID